MTEPSDYSLTSKIIALARFGQVTPRLFDLLLRKFGDIDALLTAGKGAISAIEGISPAIAQRVVASAQKLDQADELLRSLKQRDIIVTTRFDDLYPQRLFELNDPPLLLLCRGQMISRGQKTVALLGADQATVEGIEVTSKLTRLFAKANIQIISSLTGGISAAAHLAARSVGAHSFAVIDCGFDAVMSTDETALAIDIATNGGVISEYFPESQSTPESLAQSNRLLVGMADGVVFTELYRNSKRAEDALEFCDQIGKLTFYFVDPVVGALSDEETLALAVDHGAIPMRGYDSVSDIIKSLV